MLQVEDTGIGMSAEDQTTLFQPFGMIQSSKNLNKKGTGLGLYISKNLCISMDSNIYVQSQKNIGSLFSVPFKLQAPDIIQLQKKDESAVKTTSQNAAIKGKVLVVDDNSLNLQVMDSLLKTLKIECYGASNGAKAVSTIQGCSDI